MSTPLVIHIVRPYESEDAYLAAEAWSIDAKTMLLIGQKRLPADTAVLFDVALSAGQKVIKAEARVVGTVAASGNRPGGLRVRFKRFGTATKAFIDRAVSLNEQALSSAEEAPSAPESASAPDAASAPLAAEVPSSPIAVERAPEPPPQERGSPEPSPVVSAPEALAPVVHLAERSGIHRRVVAPVPAPPNREELLAKLRARSQSLAQARKASTAAEEAG